MGTTTAVSFLVHSPTVSTGTPGLLNGTKVARLATPTTIEASDDIKAVVVEGVQKKRQLYREPGAPISRIVNLFQVRKCDRAA